MQSILRLFALPMPRRARLWPVLLVTLALWHHRARSRRHLAALDDRELADIGLSRADRRAECDKRFWQA
jgi:uncharacterized protein YjiS (DUF1127 family)